MIIMWPYPSQPTPPNWHAPFDKGDLIPCTGSSTNLKPTYMSFLSHTLWSSAPCPTHSPSMLQKSGIPNHMVFTRNSGHTKPRVCILVSRQLYVPNHMATLNQTTVISFHKRTPWYLIWLKYATFKLPSSCNISSFCNDTSNALVRILEFSYIFHKMVYDRFFTCFTFPTIWHTLILIHFINNIIHSASPPSPSFNHTANLTHHLATIHSNNPVRSLSHSTN